MDRGKNYRLASNHLFVDHHKDGYTDFYAIVVGCCGEVHYRIYDKELVAEVKKRVGIINNTTYL